VDVTSTAEPVALKGSPHFRAGTMGITMRSVKVVVLAWAGLAVSVVALSYSLNGSMDAGLAIDDHATVVLEVQRGYPAWAVGIRPGQRIVEHRSGDQPGGWWIATEDETGRRGLGTAPYETMLRLTVVASMAALGCALLALVLLGLRRRRAATLAVLAFSIAAVPYLVLRSPIIGDAVVLAAGLVPAAWIACEVPLRARSRVLLVAGVSALGITNLVGVATGIAVPPALGMGNSPLALAWPALLVALAVTAVAVGTGFRAALLGAAGRGFRPLDGVVVGLVLVLALLAGFLGLPDWSAVAFALVALLGYAVSRGAVTRTLDRVLLAELREREGLRAAEEERARISREIHDDSLQALAGVIQQLEEPGADTAAARDALRTVAERLRSVATEMHPPVLDDLGLVPAIEAAANAVPSPPVAITIENRTGYARGERPPQDVELAAYRIIVEALANAVPRRGPAHHHQRRGDQGSRPAGGDR
jgi:signal transduction histidine kinase